MRHLFLNVLIKSPLGSNILSKIFNYIIFWHHKHLGVIPSTLYNNPCITYSKFQYKNDILLIGTIICKIARSQILNKILDEIILPPSSKNIYEH